MSACPNPPPHQFTLDKVDSDSYECVYRPPPSSHIPGYIRTPAQANEEGNYEFPLDEQRVLKKVDRLAWTEMQDGREWDQMKSYEGLPIMQTRMWKSFFGEGQTRLSRAARESRFACLHRVKQL